MSNLSDKGTVGQFRVVPLVDGKFDVERYDWHDPDADFAYWAFPKSFPTRKAAERYILSKVSAEEKCRRKAEEEKLAQSRFEAQNPPYVFP